MRIILDASNLGATGPEVLVRDLVPSLGTSSPQDNFILLLPSTKSGENWNLPENVTVRIIRRTKIREIGRMWDINYGLAQLCKQLRADVYFTLGDIGPVKLPVPHIIYLHQPYLVYTEKELNAVLPLFERIKLCYQRWYFARSASMADAVIVQTPVMKKRLTDLYCLANDKVNIVPPPLPSHVGNLQLNSGKTAEFSPIRPAKLNLLFLATYYPHKNHAILPALAKELRRRDLTGKVHIYLTLDGDRRKKEIVLMQELTKDSDFITNLGRLTPEDAGLALHASDALFMPTLVETYGLIYLEALATRKIILTSDRDFARYMCGELAEYFNPHDPISIADAIEKVMVNKHNIYKKIETEVDLQMLSVSGSTESNSQKILELLKCTSHIDLLR